MAAEQPEQQVTPLELFFDLVLVFAITQVTGFISAHPSWPRLVEGLAILAALWWAWVSYAWLSNSAASDEGADPRRPADGDGRPADHVARGAGGVRRERARVRHRVPQRQAAAPRRLPRGRARRPRAATASSCGSPARSIPASLLLVAAGLVHGGARDACWLLALTIDYGGLALRGVDGWRVEPAHFAERHGGIIIIALGESIVALGVGVEGLALGTEVIVSALLGIAIAGAMWWAYFDVVAIVAERRFKALDRDGQVRMARDSYTYLHLPMVAGIIVFAVGREEDAAATSTSTSTPSRRSRCAAASPSTCWR